MKNEKQSLRETVSYNVRSARIEAGLTQQEVARKTGFKVSYVARLESPQNISLDTLEKIASAFNKSPAQFLVSETKLKVNKSGIKIFNDAMKKLRTFERMAAKL